MPTKRNDTEDPSVDIDAILPEKLRRKLEEIKLSAKESVAVMAERLHRALGKKTLKNKIACQDGAGDKGDTADDISADERVVDVNSLSLSELRALASLGTKDDRKQSRVARQTEGRH